jgi:hypothetical protein
MQQTYDEFMTSARRLALLAGLAACPQYRANDVLLQKWAEGMGHPVSADRVRSDLAWLKEQELVALDAVDRLQVATLTERGLDVAEGRAQVPGVSKPKPGAAG